MTHQIGIYDHLTGEQSTREMTADELSIYEAEAAEYLAAKSKAEEEKQAAKEALLSSLKITEEQAIILGLISPPFSPIETGI